LEDYVGSKGQLQSGKTGGQLDVYMLNGPRSILSTSPGYNSYNYDYGRTGLNNFKNLSTLSKNC
jgi:hypothetical protein